MAGKIHPPETSSNYFPQYLETGKKKEKKSWPEKTLASLKTSDSIEWLRVTVNRVVTVETVTAAPDVHSR